MKPPKAFACTTTDPVEKACELAPIGPVVFIDTAGVDDVGALGLARVERTRAVLEWVDIALVVANARDFDECESDLVEHLRKLGTPAVLVINKSDLHPADEAFMTRMRAYGIPVVLTDAETKAGIADLRKAIIDLAFPKTAPSWATSFRRATPSFSSRRSTQAPPRAV